MRCKSTVTLGDLFLNEMNRKQIIILVALGAFVLFEIVVFMLGGNSSSSVKLPGTGNGVDPSGVISEEGFPVFSPEVPKSAVLSEPKLEAPASSNPALDTKIKFFDLRATKDGFIPSSITVNSGDSVRIDFTAVDGDYDLDFPYLGAYFRVVQKGVTDRLPFDTSLSGTFSFRCRDYCPQGKQIEGKLIVLPK